MFNSLIAFNKIKLTPNTSGGTDEDIVESVQAMVEVQECSSKLAKDLFGFDDKRLIWICGKSLSAIDTGYIVYYKNVKYVVIENIDYNYHCEIYAKEVT